jgi:DNA repair protein RecO (recombination protein O)
MAYYKAKAIVIRNRALREDSKIITLLTNKFGKINAISKGSRKIKSHMGAFLDLFSYINLELYHKENRETYTITSAKLITSFPSIKEDLKKIAMASCITELLDIMLTGKEKDLKIFGLTLKILKLLSKEYHFLYLYSYILKLFSFMGFHLHLKNCLFCKKEVNRKAKLSFKEGGIICLRCKDESKGMEIEVDMLNLLRNLLYLKLEEVSKIKASPELLRSLKDLILNNYLRHYLHSPLKSLRFYEERV